MFFALSMAATGISHSSSMTQDTTKAKAAAASVFAIIDRPSSIDPSDESGTVLGDVKGEIELKHISFKYPLRPNVQIFRDLCLHIRPGQVGCSKNHIPLMIMMFMMLRIVGRESHIG